MLIVRPVEAGDLEVLCTLAGMAGDGLTTLPTDQQTMAVRIANSQKSFRGEVEEVGDRVYFLALEDTATNEVIGTSAIIPAVGLREPFYNYKLLQLTQVSHDPEMHVNSTLLTLVNEYAGCSELATLFLRPDYRKSGVGRLLSAARYLLIGAQPELFSETVIAELRGWVNKSGASPFWEAVGRHFFGMSFAEADRINSQGNSQFIADLMPKYPIYSDLLSEEAREVIGKPHSNTAAAMRILEAEGFSFRGAVDIFDGGPVLEARRDAIRSVRAYRETQVSEIDDCFDGDETLVANIALEAFRVTKTPIRISPEGSGISLPEEVAEALGVVQDNWIGFIHPRGPRG